MSGANDLSGDLIRAEIEDAITNRVPAFTIEIDNRFDKWDSLLWNDPITLSIEGQGVLRGRLDIPDRSVEKSQGKILALKGRGDAGALEDIQASMHVVNMTPKDIVDKIMNAYSTMRYSADPNITVQSNLAPNDITMSFLWKRKGLWPMLRDVSDALGAPPALGGKDTFFDFYVDVTDGFYFEPIGNRDSGVSIPASLETIRRRRIIDSLSVKNDIWVWGNESAGTIPLEMQIGYNGGVGDDRTDPWTEGNAADYKKGAGVDIISDEPTEYVIGSQSIRITTLVIMSNERLFWYMPFPFGAPYPPGGSKWPGQDPAGGLNCYNETKMEETMGEINAVGFFIKSDTAFNLCLEVKDGTTGTTAAGESVRYDPGMNFLFPPWNYVQRPFGPSAGFKPTSPTAPPTDVVDWANIAELRFVVYNYPYGMGTISIFFDGFRFIKPLVVRCPQVPATPATRRIQIEPVSNIASYALAKIYGNSVLENLMTAQHYYNFENLGRVDIPIGYKFSLEGVQMLMREMSYVFSKDEGWTIKGRGFLQT
jgi:hypothetical protein